MKKLIFGSLAEGAGKTSLIVGLAKALNLKFAYLKPFGDRLIYRKKRLWDYDSALVVNLFALDQSSEDMTIGFEHAKLRYMYDEAGTKAKLAEMARCGEGKTALVVEGGKDLTYGSAVRLDTLSLVRYLGDKLILVVSGGEGTVTDDLAFIKKNLDMKNLDWSVIINKVPNLEDFKNTHLPEIKEMGVRVLGVLPYEQELTYFSTAYLAEKLQARVIAGEGGLNQTVKHVFVGAMSGDVAARGPMFKKDSKLVITGGDRSDMIVAAMEGSTAGIILTGNLVPPQNLISKAHDRNIPVLLVPFDTFETARQIDNMTPLLTKDDSRRVALLASLVSQNLDTASLL
jgi:BioD-like phosphotransacetylase family protein